jgi:hypothetical protein
LTKFDIFDIICAIKENFMVSITSAILATFVCIIGVGYTSYQIGIRKGIEVCLQHLENEGVITITEDE